MEALRVLAERTGRRIEVIDTLDAGTRNATYDTQSGKITLALDAQEGAYLYAAMHELTHALKNENAQSWEGFQAFVLEALEKNGQNVDELVSYQMERFGYGREAALEEVVCNTTPALLEEESNLRDLLSRDRTLFERVKDWIKELMEDIRKAGERLSQRSRSWAQMDALKDDREALEGIYQRMMEMLEGEKGQAREDASGPIVVKMSAKEKGDQEIESIKNQLRAEKEKVNRLPVVAAVWTKGKQGRSDAQLTKEVMEEYRASGYEVDRQGFGLVDFGEKAIDKAVHYANTDAEFAAILAAKKVVKRGIEIHSHLDHKNRGYLSTTFAAPVEVNGIKGIEAVLVKRTKGNRFTVARILAPDGATFLFEQKKDAEPTTGGGRPAAEAAAVYTPISPASSFSLQGKGENVNRKCSLRDTDETVREELSVLEEAFEQAKGHQITAMEAEKLAGKMLQKTNSTYGQEKLARQIAQIFSYAERDEGVDMRQVDSEQVALMARVLEKSQRLDMEHEEMAKPVRDYLRTTAIRLSEGQRKEAESLSGSYGAYRAALFGRVKLSAKSGTELSSLWGELSEMAPQWFPADAAEGICHGF